jgi:hypothetical protein
MLLRHDLLKAGPFWKAFLPNLTKADTIFFKREAQNKLLEHFQTGALYFGVLYVAAIVL